MCDNKIRIEKRLETKRKKCLVGDRKTKAIQYQSFNETSHRNSHASIIEFYQKKKKGKKEKIEGIARF